MVPGGSTYFLTESSQSSVRDLPSPRGGSWASSRADGEDENALAPAPVSSFMEREERPHPPRAGGGRPRVMGVRWIGDDSREQRVRRSVRSMGMIIPGQLLLGIVLCLMLVILAGMVLGWFWALG